MYEAAKNKGEKNIDDEDFVTVDSVGVFDEEDANNVSHYFNWFSLHLGLEDVKAVLILRVGLTWACLLRVATSFVMVNSF